MLINMSDRISRKYNGSSMTIYLETVLDILWPDYLKYSIMYPPAGDVIVGMSLYFLFRHSNMARSDPPTRLYR